MKRLAVALTLVSLALLWAPGAGLAVYEGDIICTEYPNTKLRSYKWGTSAVCMGSGGGCAECYDPDTGAACQTTGTSCTPRQDNPPPSA